MFSFLKTIIIISCNFFRGFLKIEKHQFKTKSKVFFICYHLNNFLPQPIIKSNKGKKKFVT